MSQTSLAAAREVAGLESSHWPPSTGFGVALQKLVDEGDRHAALADGGGAAFDRAETHVAAGKDPGDIRFEQVGLAILLPLPGFQYVRAGLDITALIALYLLRQPVCLCISADEDEKPA